MLEKSNEFQISFTEYNTIFSNSWKYNRFYILKAVGINKTERKIHGILNFYQKFLIKAGSEKKKKFNKNIFYLVKCSVHPTTFIYLYKIELFSARPALLQFPVQTLPYINETNYALMLVTTNKHVTLNTKKCGNIYFPFVSCSFQAYFQYICVHAASHP